MTGVTLSPVERLRFQQVEPAPYTATETESIARTWQAAREANPNLFDGPIVSVRKLGWEGTICRVEWSAGKYSQYLWRYAPGPATGRRFARSLFTSVLPVTTDGRAILGRMAVTTSTPGRTQLPGGNVELPPGGVPLTEEGVRAEAVRELAEETGLVLSPDQVTLWLVKSRGDHGDVGIIFRASHQNAVDLRKTFTRHRQRLMLDHEQAEFTSLLAVSHLPDRGERALPRLLRPYADYVPRLLSLTLGHGAMAAQEWHATEHDQEEKPDVRG